MGLLTTGETLKKRVFQWSVTKIWKNHEQCPVEGSLLIWCFQTIGLHSLRVLEARSLQGFISSRNSGKESFLASSSFWWSPAFLSLWLHHSSLCILAHIIFCFVCVFVISLCLYQALVMVFRVHSGNEGQSPDLKDT